MSWVVHAAMVAGIMYAAHGLRRQSSRAVCGARGGGSASVLDQPNMSIVNGNTAKECVWKWQIAIKDRGDNSPWCGGTLIDSDWILTAAHCVEDEKAKDLEVFAGKINRKSSSKHEQKRRVSKIYMHPKYNSKTEEFDIALMRADKPFTMNECVGTACLPSSDVPEDTTVWITGFGDLKEDGKSPSQLQESYVNVVSNSACQKSYKGEKITSDMLCASGTRGGKPTDACQGDSGGPLVSDVSGVWTVYGATSWGYGCADPKYPGVYSRVHHVIGWINNIMKK